VETVTFWTAISVYESSKLVMVKCHACALAALYSTDRFHTLTAYRKHFSVMVHYRGTLETISHCVVYKTTTNVCCFAAGKLHQLQSTWGGRRNHRRLHMQFLFLSISHWQNDLCWNSLCWQGTMLCKNFILLINLCVKFSYFILTQNHLF